MVSLIKTMKFLKNINLSKKIIAFDTETTGNNPYGDFKRYGYYPARPFAFSFCDPDGNTDYVRWDVDPFTRKVIIEPKSFSEIKSIIENPSITKIAHNMNFDMKMCSFIGMNFKGNFEDTIIGTHIVTGGSEITYALKSLSEKYLDFSSEDEKELEESAKQERREAKRKGWKIAEGNHFGTKPHKADFWLANKEFCKKYAVQDAERCMLLWMNIKDRIANNLDFKRTYEREKRLFFTVMRMELLGTRIFPEKLVELKKFYEEYKEKQIKIANKHGGEGLNFRSAPQKSFIFYDKKKYRPKYFTKKGNPSTDGDSLTYFVQKYNDKLAKAILEYNGADHMITGFIDPYERFKVFENGNWVLHPNFKQTGTETGRFSGSDPNLMQVADNESGRKKSEIDFRPREIFGPRKGYVWYLPDFSQMEVWIFCILSGEPSLIDPMLQGSDFHENVAKQVWGKEKDYFERSKHYRLRAKLVVFCKFYGGGVDKIAYLLNTSREEASKFVFELDTRFPAISKFIRRMSNRALEAGKIVNPFGRTYFIPNERTYKAVNYLVQGTCADILKESMIRIDKLFRTKWKGNHMLLTLHDELVLEIRKEHHCYKIMREIIEAMQADSRKVGMPIPLPVGMKIAKNNWAKSIKIEKLSEEWKTKYITKNQKS